MTVQHIRNVVEAALLAAAKPLDVGALAQLFDEDVRPEKAQVVAALEELRATYEERALELKETASGWRVQIRQGYAREIGRLWPERPQRYSRALLETLALIAYRQPITRAEIESVRGVAVNPNIIKTLMERDWVRVVGQRDVPGHPELLGTTKEFLDYFGLRSIDELPPLVELKSMEDLNPQLTLPVEADADGGDGSVAFSVVGSHAPAEGHELPAGGGDDTVFAVEVEAEPEATTASAVTADDEATADQGGTENSERH